MAVSTGNMDWQKRYNQFEPELGVAINQLISLAPDVYEKSGVQQTDDANLKLIAMETQAFNLLEQGKKVAAADVLFSNEYEKQKQIYSKGMEASTNAIRSRLEEKLKVYRQRIILGGWIASLCFGLLMMTWGVILWLMKKHLIERKRIEEELRNYKDHLEEQVDQRTQELNQSLQQVEQQNTTLLASNRKLEDLKGTKEQLLENLSVLDKTHLRALKSIHEELLQIPGSSSELIKKAFREIYEIDEILRPINILYDEGRLIQSKRVLLAETNKKQQIIAKMALGGTGVEMDIASSLEEGQQLLGQSSYDLLCVNSELTALGAIAHQQSPEMQIVLMTSQNASVYLPLLNQYPFLSNIVSRNDEDRSFTLKNITTTISKLMIQDLFGLEKYLNWGVDVHSHPVTHSEEREELINKMESYFQKLGVRPSMIKKSEMVAEEFLMNAIYDAPHDSMGNPLYNHMSRTDSLQLKEEEQGRFRYACDGFLIAISVEDPFGALDRQTILDYLESCYSGKAGTLQKGKGGAGRGLFQIMETSDLLIINVKHQVKTEVIAIFNIDPNKPKSENNTSFHYFSG